MNVCSDMAGFAFLGNDELRERAGGVECDQPMTGRHGDAGLSFDEDKLLLGVHKFNDAHDVSGAVFGLLAAFDGLEVLFFGRATKIEPEAQKNGKADNRVADVKRSVGVWLGHRGQGKPNGGIRAVGDGGRMNHAVECSWGGLVWKA